MQPVPAPADSNPRITWGRFYAEGEKTLLPVSVLCNHALVDGVHIAAFYRRLEAEMAALCAEPQGAAARSASCCIFSAIYLHFGTVFLRRFAL